MCLGIPDKVIRTFHEHDVLMGKVDFGGVSKQVCLEHVPDVAIGQYVLVHVGFALSKIDEDEGQARVRVSLMEWNQLDDAARCGGRGAAGVKYLDEYRDPVAAREARRSHQARTVTRPWVIMEVCGGQTHTIVKYGVDRVIPDCIELVHGPGCPVCVTALETIDRAHAIASRPGVIFCSFGDMLRVPGSQGGSAVAQIAQGLGRSHCLFAARCGEPGGGQSESESRLLRDRI